MVPLFDQNEVAALLGLSPRTLERFRTTGSGPRFARLGRRIFYRECDLNDWVEMHLRNSTSENPPLDRRVPTS
jgi:predicted DNA-binding transcriptional regulator AlpA